MSKTRKITEIAVCVALSVICSFLKVWEMPQGGSVSLTMVPILFLAKRRGVACGVVGGAIYGLLSVLFAGVVYHPASILLDYVLAFGFLGLAGLFGKSVRGITAGCILGIGGRFVCSVISGAILFAEYAPEGQNPWLYSVVYQATYMVPELIISVGVLLLLYKKANRLFEV